MRENTEQILKQDSVSKLDVIIMSVSAAAPAMCLGGSFGAIMQGAGSAAALAFLIATLVIVMVGMSYGQLSNRYNSAGGTLVPISTIVSCIANIKDRWNEKGAASLLVNKLVPVVSGLILVYMIFSSDFIYVAATAVWALASWIAALIWSRYHQA